MMTGAGSPARAGDRLDAAGRGRRVTAAALDRVLAAAALLVAAPLALAFAALIRLDGPGPVLFVQMRAGRQGRPFPLLKLRTMVVGAEVLLAARIARDPDLAAEWVRFGCLRRDPRIAGPAARLARRWSVDEIPQLWNVLRGEMALVGPRPLTAVMASSLAPVDHRARTRVLPGLTGLWQVRGRSDLDLRQMMRYDRFYVRRAGTRLDLWILARTPAAVLSRRGAV